MVSKTTHPFRFLDLPAEIRDNVYEILLCSFEQDPETWPWSAEIEPGTLLYEARKLKRSRNSTSILRVSSEVHREAYDVFVKRNKFIRVEVINLPLTILLEAYGIQPAMSSVQEDPVEDFPGCVLELSIQVKNPPIPEDGLAYLSHYRSLIVILGRDFEKLCTAVGEVYLLLSWFPRCVHLKVKMAPMLAAPRRRYMKFIADYFSEATKNQEELLHPLRTHLREIENVTISGPVPPGLAVEVKKEIAQGRWISFQTLLNDAAMRKDVGRQNFVTGDMNEADRVWTQTSTMIESVRESASWSRLVREGGNQFVEQIADIFSAVNLNLVAVHLKNAQDPNHRSHDLSDPVRVNPLRQARGRFECLTRGEQPDHWTQGYTHKISDALLPKIRYRWAVLMRLDGDVEELPLAKHFIESALQATPNDPVLLREQRAIRAWELSLQDHGRAAILQYSSFITQV